MKTDTVFWRDWWNEFANRSGEDFEVDRGTTLRIDELERRAARQFLAAVDPKQTDLVLDAGCGTGANFSKLNGLVAGIVGVDFSEEMLKRAEQRIITEKIANVKLQFGNVTKMEFPTGSFDKVVCTSVLQYLDDDECEAAFKEMVRVSKKGSIIVIHLKNRTSLYGMTRALTQFVARLLHKKTIPDKYRPRVWYERIINENDCEIVDYDSFGIFTPVKLPSSLKCALLKLEIQLPRATKLKKYGVNYKVTIRTSTGK